MWLGTFFLWLTFPAGVEAYSDGNAQVFVAVYNDAGVSAGELAQAERKGARIFAGAGIDVVWADCTSSATHVGPDALVRAGEQSSPQNLPARVSAANPAELRSAGRARAPAPAYFPVRCDLTLGFDARGAAKSRSQEEKCQRKFPAGK